MTDIKTHIVPSGLKEFLAVFLRNPGGMAGLVMLMLIMLSAVFGPIIYGLDPFDIVSVPFSPPDEYNRFGTDYVGRDILAGVLTGGRATLTVGLTAALITVLIGVAVGSLSGYFGGLTDMILMKITEFFQVLPTLLFAMVMVTILSPSLFVVTVAIGIASWMNVARLTRAEFKKLKERDFVKSVVAAGATPVYIMLKTILPNALPPIIVSAAFDIGWAILLEGSLSFLGLGDPNRMSWGLIIGQNKSYVLDAWWTVVIPGTAIFLAVLSVCLVGDGLNDALNPRQRLR